MSKVGMQLFEIGRLVHFSKKRGQFVVKWGGYPVSDNTWEYKANLPRRTVADWFRAESRRKSQSKARKRRRRWERGRGKRRRGALPAQVAARWCRGSAALEKGDAVAGEVLQGDHREHTGSRPVDLHCPPARPPAAVCRRPLGRRAGLKTAGK